MGCGAVKPQDDEQHVRPTLTAENIPLEYFRTSSNPTAFCFVCINIFGTATVISRAA
jgi:hypothetical protein